jgi:alanine-glyoxylate transaminase/serine-glyoxylate transaminase/serine-pyruvate transaminase
MCPPGVAFVWANDRAIERYRSLDPTSPRSSYFDWANRLEPRGFYDTYAGTPPVLHLRAIDVALDLIDEEGGVEAVWARHDALSAAVRAAVDAWSTPGGVEFNITSPEHRSNAVTTVLTGQIDSEELMRRCRDDMGVTLGIGVALSPGGSFRIGHMGHLNPPMILGTLATVETALRQMGAPLGASGIEAATVALAESPNR